jgi:hypothetical protein
MSSDGTTKKRRRLILSRETVRVFGTTAAMLGAPDSDEGCIAWFSVPSIQGPGCKVEEQPTQQGPGCKVEERATQQGPGCQIDEPPPKPPREIARPHARLW